MQQDNEKVPFFKKWSGWYIAVILFLLLLIVLFYFFTKYFD